MAELKVLRSVEPVETGSFPALGAELAASFQRSLKSPVSCTGMGLHSGRPVTMSLLPAPAGHGIVFQRTDLAGEAGRVEASWDKVVNTSYCTMIGNEHGATISTIEHLMAALAGAGVDNLLVELDGPEVPVMDGSAAPFVFLIECAGTIEQDLPRRALKIRRRVTVENDGKLSELVPARDFQIHFQIDFDGLIGRQDYAFRFTSGAFKAELARARTFAFEHEIDHLRSVGLAQGGSLDNAVVVSGDRILNDSGLRYGDEFVRHKVLDCLGDLYMVGGPIIGHYRGERAGHAMTNRLLRAVFADPANYEWVELDGATATVPARAPATHHARPFALAATA
jgi:UDP-3-O-[3-hydroxymyristoyl] N-acetylglucosamine deacetylase